MSIFKNIWFHKSGLDIETNLKFVVLWLQDWFAFKVVRSELKLNNSTITDWSSFCREVVVNWVVRNSKKIGGPDCIVETDESKFGRRKYNVGRLIEGQWVFGGICRETQEFFVVPVPERNRETLLRVIKDNIYEGTTIISDCWKSYNCLGLRGRGIQASYRESQY